LTHPVGLTLGGRTGNKQIAAELVVSAGLVRSARTWEHSLNQRDMLQAAMEGRTTRFTRQDGVEEQWRIMQPLLDAPPPVHPYAPASWGPKEADQLVADYGGWLGPWV
jgi:glucose-6-phosphate 1-dehydrogenase